MRDDQWQRVCELFERAAERPSDERAAFLREACADDSQVLAEVLALLEHDSDDESPLVEVVQRAAGRHAASVAQSLVGARIGPYEVISHLGDGGFGSVYVAEQAEPLRRRVALKLIKKGMDSAEVIARFQAERQALALMDHPGIARVIDAGTSDDGQPFFAMELVEGPAITTYCDERRLSVSQRLELFGAVCDAVEHAHQRGILHRDLKPPNILVATVDGKPQPKVIDFGVAKALEGSISDETLTRELRMVGTPEYMSPEQAGEDAAAVDTRSDIYSLGVLLYELLTGATPFSRDALRRAGVHEILRVLREEDPPLPSLRLSGDEAMTDSAARSRSTAPATLGRLLRGDLDWIAMKALEKERDRRYASVGGLAADIRRHLDDEPVSAGPPDSAYRARKFLRRHRGGAIAAMFVLTALLAGLAAALLGMAEARRERERAIAAEHEARVEAEAAQQISNFLIELFHESVPTRPGSGEITARELLDRGAERIERELDGQPEIQARLIDVMGNVYGAMQQQQPARDLIERGLRMRREQHRGDHPDVATSLQSMGAVLYEEGDLDGAERHYVESLEMRRRLYGERHASVVRSLIAVGSVQHFKGQIDEARETYTKALEVASAVHAADHPDVIELRGRVAGILMASGRAAEAEQQYTELIATLSAKHGEEHAATADAMSDLAVLLKNRGAYEEAEPIYRRVLEIRQAIFGPDHSLVAQSLNNFGSYHNSRGNYAAAEPLLREAVATYVRALGPDHQSIAFALNNLSRALTGLGRAEEGLEVARRALGLSRAAMGDAYWVNDYIRASIGLALRGLGREDEARSELEAAHAGLLAKLGPDSGRTRAVATLLGEVEKP